MGSMDWTGLTYSNNTDKQRVLVNADMNLRVP
jgi:hypothetical protein